MSTATPEQIAAVMALIKEPSPFAKRVVAAAIHVWGSDEDARAFLTTPHSELDGSTPIEASQSEMGARRVEGILGRLYFGVAA